MPFPTAAQRRLQNLYHWQAFNASRLEDTLRNNTIYCSSPRDFNDPWDCRPYFNTDLVNIPEERNRHIEWAVDVCRRIAKMSEGEISRMRRELQDPQVLGRYLREQITATQEAVLDRYRVYCLGTDPCNSLMWAHYADKHRGVCLEFNVSTNTFCGALEVQYYHEFPMTRQYSADLAENLLPLLAKSDVWRYENEFRLAAQEASNATDHETLVCNHGTLQLGDGDLRSIIVGCSGSYDAVRQLVANCRPEVQVLRAHRVQNRYALSIGS